MNDELNIEELRRKIDECDNRLVSLFAERMKTAGQVAEYKRKNLRPVFDPERERALLARVSGLAGEEFSDYAKVLYSTVLSLSKEYQQKCLGGESETVKLISEALEKTPKMFPSDATVAVQGVEGAYSGQAAERLFGMPLIRYLPTFNDVFFAIENGACRYGVLPIENSTAGSVSKIYDLIQTHHFYIVRSVRLKVNHCLVAKPGVKLSEIKEIYSHEQAIGQCAGFIRSLDGVKATTCANTAVAARTVSESERRDIAAICSVSCAGLYGLSVVSEAVQDNGNNHTRFICISREAEIYPGADRTSIMAVTDHRPGALYTLLSEFFALGINLIKLESRPIPDCDFEFMFYFDLEASVYSEKLMRLLGLLERQNKRFRYLGSYTETV